MDALRREPDLPSASVHDLPRLSRNTRVTLRSRGRLTWRLAAVALLGGCAATPADLSSISLTARLQPVDTSGVTDALRELGGDAFVKLTGRAGPAELADLKAAGLSFPSGYTQFMTFDSILPSTVWGHIAAHGVRRIAEVPYVIRIESSADSGLIYLQ